MNEYLVGPSGDWKVNCFDTAHALVTGANYLGHSMRYYSYGRDPDHPSIPRVRRGANALSILGSVQTNSPTFEKFQSPPLQTDCRGYESYQCPEPDGSWTNHSFGKYHLSPFIWDPMVLVPEATASDRDRVNPNGTSKSNCQNKTPGTSSGPGNDLELVLGMSLSTYLPRLLDYEPVEVPAPCYSTLGDPPEPHVHFFDTIPPN